MVDELKSQGHEVRVSDLYAMGWKPQVDSHDFPGATTASSTDNGHGGLSVVAASRDGYLSHTLTEDVRAEQEKLLWADAVVLQFPLWWFSMPAILKGWVDRVFSCGFAYGTGEHNSTHWGDRYGEGPFVGKRAMLVVTTGGMEGHYSSRGINGPMQDLLNPINHGVLFYTGFDVLPPYVVYSAARLEGQAGGYKVVADRLRERVRTLAATSPIPYRRQNYGDYEIPSLTLREDVDTGDVKTGFALHVRASPDEG
jgi:NAD(P)H dehydrogenase (quinone)